MKTGTQYIEELLAAQLRARRRGDYATANRLQIAIDQERRDLLKRATQRMNDVLRRQKPVKKG